mmetsp:Transcript_80870/g.121553  ORF Transcript_80870/g.121553 Transcript_80870/m.121553 type:complete len:227 (+) Transcript_80870:679-1359(+)
MPRSCLGQSIVAGIVHACHLNTSRIGELALQVRVDALQSHIRQRCCAKDVLRPCHTHGRVQPIGATESHQHIFQWANVPSIQQHVRFVDDQRCNVGEHCNMFRFETQRSNGGRGTDDQIDWCIVAAQGQGVTKRFEIQWICQTSWHDSESHNGVGVNIFLIAARVLWKLRSRSPQHRFVPSTQGKRHTQHLLHQLFVGYQDDCPGVIVRQTLPTLFLFQDIIQNWQ